MAVGAGGTWRGLGADRPPGRTSRQRRRASQNRSGTVKLKGGPAAKETAACVSRISPLVVFPLQREANATVTFALCPTHSYGAFQVHIRSLAAIGRKPGAHVSRTFAMSVARLSTPALSKIIFKWNSTVPSLMPSVSAIETLVRPWATQRNTSVWRAVRCHRTPAARIRS